MKGILAVNHFLNTEKFNILTSHLANTAKNMGIELEVKSNLELALFEVQADFVLFWDKDVNVARALEKKGLKVFNSSRSIELCDDKARTYVELIDRVEQPQTLIAPKAYFKVDMSDFVKEAIERLGLPLVFKECFGSFGEQVFLCNSQEEILDKISDKPFVLQKFIASSHGQDVRLEVVGGECVCAVKRENKNDFRSNVTNSGTMTPYEPTPLERELAITACQSLGLTFGGVDILDHRLVCEVNSNAHIINIMNATGVDIAPIIFDTIREKIK
jgi:RimK family alpha-L-glutamate ligase